MQSWTAVYILIAFFRDCVDRCTNSSGLIGQLSATIQDISKPEEEGANEIIHDQDILEEFVTAVAFGMGLN